MFFVENAVVCIIIIVYRIYFNNIIDEEKLFEINEY